MFYYKANPTSEWQQLSDQQQGYVDTLNEGKTITFRSPTADVSFSINNRRWINSDGKRNMPSGEVFTSPLETSGNVITFDHPSLLFGEVIDDLTLYLESGK